MFAQWLVGLVNNIPRVHSVVDNSFGTVKRTYGGSQKACRYGSIALYEKDRNIRGRVHTMETRADDENAP